MKKQRIEIGKVIFVQVQRVPLKQGPRSERYYDPSGLVRVPGLDLSPNGVVGLAADGERILDAHHRDHPESRFMGLNGISVGFTPHYERMRNDFGDHLTDGIAGENVIVESEKAFSVDDLQGLLVFENPDGSECRMRLYKAMAPCDEFSHFAKQAKERLPASTLKATLQALEDGRRGFTIALDDADAGRVLAGARLVLEPV